MCQFYACQPSGESNQELFYAISSEVAATVRAGWWAYQYQDSHTPGGVHHASYYVPASNAYYPSQVNSVAYPSVPTYDYGYGTEF